MSSSRQIYESQIREKMALLNIRLKIEMKKMAAISR